MIIVTPQMAEVKARVIRQPGESFRAFLDLHPRSEFFG